MTQSILVADDEPSILLSLQFLLKKAGFEVRLAHNGEEVLQAVEQSTPDLLLLAGRWTDELVERVLDRAALAGGGL